MDWTRKALQSCVKFIWWMSTLAPSLINYQETNYLQLTIQRIDKLSMIMPSSHVYQYTSTCDIKLHLHSYTFRDFLTCFWFIYPVGTIDGIIIIIIKAYTTCVDNSTLSNQNFDRWRCWQYWVQNNLHMNLPLTHPSDRIFCYICLPYHISEA